MKISIQKSKINGKIIAPSSKSYTHRAITIAALSSNSTVINPLISKDTEATIDACRAFGADIQKKENELIIKGVKGKPQIPDNVIDVKNSGTTLRIMTAIFAFVDGVTVLTGDSSIIKRPNNPLLLALNNLGINAYSTRNNGCAPIIVNGGKIKCNKISIDGSISSQFISALLISCPLIKTEKQEIITISIIGELKSRPYVDITLELLNNVGAKIEVKEKGDLKFIISTNQTYHLKEYTVPGDFSSASYLLAAGAMIENSDITLKNVFPSKQGDAEIINILKKMGADIVWDSEGGIVTVKYAGKLHGITVDVGKTPDLVPTIAVLGCVAEGTTIIENAAHVRLKETDRLHAMAVELKKMGVDITEELDKLSIKGGTLKWGADLHGWEDHRIVMSLTLAGLVVGNATIDTAESIAISYPDFFDVMKRCGADIKILD